MRKAVGEEEVERCTIGHADQSRKLYYPQTPSGVGAHQMVWREGEPSQCADLGIFKGG